MSFNGRIQNAAGASGTQTNDNPTKGIGTLRGFVLDASNNVLKEIATQSNTTENVTDIFSVPENNNYITVKLEKDWNIGYIDDIFISPIFDSLSNGSFSLQGKNWTLSKSDIQFYNDAETNINGTTCLMPDFTSPRSIEQYMTVTPGEEYLFSFNGRVQDAVGASGSQPNSTNSALVGQILTKHDYKLAEISTVSSTDQYLSTVFNIPDTVNFVKVKIFKNHKIAYVDDVTLLRTQGSSGINTTLDHPYGLRTQKGAYADQLRVISGMNSIRVIAMSSIYSIKLSDLTGKTVLERNCNSTTDEVIYLNNPGLYIADIKLTNGARFKAKTIIY